jgi:hypothetical protein
MQTKYKGNKKFRESPREEIVQHSFLEDQSFKEEFEEDYSFKRYKKGTELEWKLEVGGDITKTFDKRGYSFRRRIESSYLTGPICTKIFCLTRWPFEKDVVNTPFFVSSQYTSFPGNPEQKNERKGPLDQEKILEKIRDVRLGRSSVYLFEFLDKTRKIYKADEGNIPLDFSEQEALPFKKGKLIQRIQAKHLARKIITVSALERHKRGQGIRNIEKIEFNIGGDYESKFEFYSGDNYEKYLMETFHISLKDDYSYFDEFEEGINQKEKLINRKLYTRTKPREVGRFFDSEEKALRYYLRLGTNNLPKDAKKIIHRDSKNFFVPAQNKHEKQKIEELFRRFNLTYRSLREMIVSSPKKVPIDPSANSTNKIYYEKEQQQKKYIEIDFKLGCLFKDLIDFALSESLIYLPKSIKTPGPIIIVSPEDEIRKQKQKQIKKECLSDDKKTEIIENEFNIKFGVHSMGLDSLYIAYKR